MPSLDVNSRTSDAWELPGHMCGHYVASNVFSGQAFFLLSDFFELHCKAVVAPGGLARSPLI